MMRKSLSACIALLSVAFPSLAGATDVLPVDRVKRGVLVREDPTTDSVALGSIAPGGRATLLEEVPGWYRIELPDGRTGYVSKIWTEIGAQALLAAPSGGFKIHVIDVGTGLAVFVEGPGFTLLYDAGSQDDLASENDNRVVAYINKVRPGLTTIDHLVLSHPHKDHLQLLPDVFDRYKIRNVWNSGAINKTQGYCRFLRKVAAETGVQYHDAISSSGAYQASFSGSSCSGTVSIPRAAMMTAAPVQLGSGARMSILYRNAEKHSDPNENTVVVRLDLGSRRVLLAGDAEGGGRLAPSTPPSAGSIEAELIAKPPAELKADVLVVGHHGSLTSSRTAFLDAVQAKTFLISSGPFPYKKVRLPDADVVAELGRRGTVWSTATDDENCGEVEAKIGPDADESPGGCNNILVTVGADGALSTAYNKIAD
ncbi:MAG: MBL fold metallo-hydrolase [Rhizorhabdus sp.]|uniref:MBL fold metallo-hydrolase n=1 Tax=Rhizorhabdus sp. TaxID=1968843 RepID=UPI001B4BD68E|nr:MBL fold metallo-hydrolase [Rhizorhabdus sp.]MBP8232857.1 MBL fold metallo-hydrolase [Rhizorhabdus sp.]